MDDFTGLTALVTGAASGIGRGIAKALADEGARLALADLDAPTLSETASQLRNVTNVTEHVLDVRDREAFDMAADRIEAELGPIRILCNNAGIVFPEDATKLTYELWDLVLGVNFDGVVNGVQTVLPRMLRRGDPAHIVNTSSIAGLGPGGGVLYSTSKYAVVGLSESLAERLGEAGIPVGVTALCPGAVATDIVGTSRKAVMREEETSAEARAHVEQLSESSAELLAEHGHDPDEVGRMVVEAIKSKRRFVLTDRAAEHKVRERTSQIIESMPHNLSDDTTIYRSAKTMRGESTPH